MFDEFENFARNLQDQIYKETKKAFGDVAFARWLNPVHQGPIPDPDGYALVTGICGDTMEIFLKVEHEQVQSASFRTSGCASSIVCGSFAAELAHGKSPDGITEITAEMILGILGGMPKEDRHCAFLAAQTLQEALEDYMKKQ